MSSNQDMERLVLEDLENRGQNGFKIITNSWTVGTNIRTIVLRETI